MVFVLIGKSDARMKANVNECWYALYTKSRAEKRVYKALMEEHIEAYLPLHLEQREWSDRKKWVEMPVVRSYVFVKASPCEHYKVLNVSGVVRFVYFDGKPAIIPDCQIKTLKATIESNLRYKLVSTPLKKGDRIIIKGGPLEGFQGEITDPSRPNQLLIRINHIGYSMVVTISSDKVDSMDT